jgi:hypothetical protein
MQKFNYLIDIKMYFSNLDYYLFLIYLVISLFITGKPLISKSSLEHMENLYQSDMEILDEETGTFAKLNSNKNLILLAGENMYNLSDVYDQMENKVSSMIHLAETDKVVNLTTKENYIKELKSCESKICKERESHIY